MVKSLPWRPNFWNGLFFRDKCEQEGKRSDGIDPLDRVREFRRALYTRIQFAVAAGCGEMLVRAGQAWG
jgi:hypothetical protein